jgi:hypothetical protein
MAQVLDVLIVNECVTAHVMYATACTYGHIYYQVNGLSIIIFVMHEEITFQKFKRLKNKIGV